MTWRAAGSSDSLLMLVDGHSLAFRAFHALPDTIRTDAGEPIHAVYGFLGMLFRLIEEWRPRFVGVAFDEGRSFRHDLIDTYKPRREDGAPDVESQVEHLRTVLGGLDCWQVGGVPFEADDHIATVTAQAEEAGLDVVVVTGDRDLLQLVSPHTRVLYSGSSIRSSTLVDEAAVHAQMGVTPAQLTDYKGLVGDPSDNFHGVRGVGAKTAADLIAKFGSLEGIYANLDAVSPGPRAKLQAGREMAFLCREVSRLRFDAPSPLDLEMAEFGFAWDKATPPMLERGMATLVQRLPMRYARSSGSLKE